MRLEITGPRFGSLNVKRQYLWEGGSENFKRVVGMKHVVDRVHSLGLKFGIYADRGPKTCSGGPGSGGREQGDAATFASWGVDYLKEDSCNVDADDHALAFREYAVMRDALAATDRAIYFSLCGWKPWYAPEGASLGNSWRTTGDVTGWPSVYNTLHLNSLLAAHSGPGAPRYTSTSISI